MSSQDRLTIYMQPQLADALDARRPDQGDSWRSSTITNMVARYAEIVRREVPALAPNEWKLLCDALNGTWLLEHAGSAPVAVTIAHEVSDAIALNGLDRKWDVADGGDLVRRIDALGFAAKVAIVDVVERFWSRPSAGDAVLDEAVRPNESPVVESPSRSHTATGPARLLCEREERRMSGTDTTGPYAVLVADCAGVFDRIDNLTWPQALATVHIFALRYPQKVVVVSNRDRADVGTNGLTDEEYEDVDRMIESARKDARRGQG